MDAQEQLVWDGQFSAAVLGKGSDFALISLEDEERIDGPALQEAIAKGFRYCGVMAVVNGQAAARCEPDPDSVLTMMHAAFAFARIAAEHIKTATAAKSAAWLQQLFELPDSRDKRI